MLIERVPLDALVLDPANARKHNTKNLETIKGSLAKFGQQKPIVVGKNNVVIAGNGTLEAARQLGWKDLSVVRTELTGTDATAFALADNRTSELAEWDIEILSETLKALQAVDFDIGVIGFDDIMAPPAPGLTDDDAVPEAAETRVKPGDLWLLGSHRLLCGDSTNVQHVERLMGGCKKESTVLITDPPYGVNLGEHGAANEKRSGFQSRKGYRSVADTKENFSENVVQVIASILPMVCRAAVFGVPPNIWEFPAPDVLGGIYISAATGRNAWGFSNFYAVLLYGKRPDLHNGSYPVVLNSNARGDDVDHPTSKPVAWMEWLVGMCTRDTDSVIEPFLGSGSTLIACEKTARRCFGMEIDAHYCDVVLKRWEDYTGKTAVLSEQKESA